MKSKTKRRDLSHISKDLRRLARPINAIIPDPNNARLHPLRNFESTKASLEKYGQRKNIVVNKRTGLTEAGHCTVQAALALGWSWLAVSYEDEDEDMAAGYGIADNKTAELALWKESQLAETLTHLIGEQSIADFPELGFNEQELIHLLEKTQQTPPELGTKHVEFTATTDGHPPHSQGVCSQCLEYLKSLPHDDVRGWMATHLGLLSIKA